MYVKSLSQLSVAVGAEAWAVANPAASLHWSVVFNALAVVVQVGAVVSVTLIVWEELIVPQLEVILNVLVTTIGQVPVFVSEYDIL